MKIAGIIWLWSVIDKVVFFIYKRSREALVISARDMSRKERRRYGKK